MKVIIKRVAILAALIFAVSTFSNAQALKIDPKTSFIVIQGSSNLHAWESKTQQINGQLAVNYAAKQIQSLVVSIPVKSIKSGEKLMDSKTYDAFNAEKYPTIDFKLIEINSLQTSPNSITVNLTGNLTLAGVTKRISFKAVGKPLKGDDTFNFTGSVSLKMTDFKINPPTAMMGMLKVGDNVTVKFNITIDGVNVSSL